MSNHIEMLGRLAAKQAFDMAGMANKAIQSPIGQGALSLGSNLYNRLPQRTRNFAAGKALDMGGFKGNPNWRMPGFTPDPSQGTGVRGKTVVENDDLVKDRIMSMQPGHAGSPMSQIARGVMTGQMPRRTFPQGTPVANKVVVNNDNLTKDKLVPQAKYDRKFGK